MSAKSIDDEADVDAELRLLEIEWATERDALGATRSKGVRGRSRTWQRLRVDLPPEVTTLLRGRIRRAGYRIDALERCERELGIERRKIGPVGAATAWKKLLACTPERTLAVLGESIHSVLRQDHQARLTDQREVHHVADSILDPSLVDGALRVRDPTSAARQPYLPSFLEVTPAIVIGHAIAAVRRRQPHQPLRAWDVTAGSGTGHHIVQAAGGACISSDIIGHYQPVITLDARNMGSCAHHQARGNRISTAGERDPRPRLAGDELCVPQPNLILIDPPARGWPTHSAAYLPDSNLAGLDLGILGRDEWLAAVSGLVRRALDHLAADGVVSLLVREGERHGFEVLPDDALTRDLIGTLQEMAKVIEQVPVVYERPARQAFAGSARLPMRHLVMARMAAE